MSDPLVCAIMLCTDDRHAMAERAAACFAAQTYARKDLLIWNTTGRTETIGELRNEACRHAMLRSVYEAPDIFVAWDSDDWSHPRRISEQVALLRLNGADLVGYSDLPFWRVATGEAFLYRGDAYAPGTTHCLWRRTWEARHYQDESQQEDWHFQRDRKITLASSLVDDEPRMIATVHGANHNAKQYERLMGNPECTEYRRTPEWDDYCRRVLG